MNVCLKDCFLSVNFFCSSKKICSEGVTCPCVTVSRDFKMVIELMNLEVELSLSLHFFFHFLPTLHARLLQESSFLHKSSGGNNKVPSWKK